MQRNDSAKPNSNWKWNYQFKIEWKWSQLKWLSPPRDRIIQIFWIWKLLVVVDLCLTDKRYFQNTLCHRIMIINDETKSQLTPTDQIARKLRLMRTEASSETVINHWIGNHGFMLVKIQIVIEKSYNKNFQSVNTNQFVECSCMTFWIELLSYFHWFFPWCYFYFKQRFNM